MLNTQVSKYKISDYIKSGGMADVYQGVDEQTKEKVAIKILNPDFQNDKEIVKRFHKEGAVLEKLNHPNIVKFLYFTEVNGRPIMVMEYLEGYDMNELMKKQDVIDYKLFRNYFLQVLDAIIYAHSQGVIHRDIKPSNIFITKEGVVKLLDFGIVKIMTNTDGNETTKGYGFLTPSYMSPEQATYSKNINEKTDIYSLGVTMYSVLNGKNPYEGMSAFEIGGQVLYKSLPDLPGHTALNKVIVKATHKNQDDRYLDAFEFKSDLLKVTTQCLGIVKSGERCQKMTIHSSGLCAFHQNLSKGHQLTNIEYNGPVLYASDILADLINKKNVTKDEALHLVLSYIYQRKLTKNRKVFLNSDSRLKKLFFNITDIYIEEIKYYIICHLSFDTNVKPKWPIGLHKIEYITSNKIKLTTIQNNKNSVANGDLVYIDTDFAHDGIYIIENKFSIRVLSGRVDGVLFFNDLDPEKIEMLGSLYFYSILFFDIYLFYKSIINWQIFILIIILMILGFTVFEKLLYYIFKKINEIK